MKLGLALFSLGLLASLAGLLKEVLRARAAQPYVPRLAPELHFAAALLAGVGPGLAWGWPWGLGAGLAQAVVAVALAALIAR